MIQEYNKLINSKEFKNWRSRHKDSYLSSCFIMQDQNSKGSWNFDYYLPRINKLTTFILEDEIKINQNQKIFEPSHKRLKEINPDDVKFTLDKLNNLIKNEFKDAKFIKIIIILQARENLMWNVSLLGLNFNLINVKVDAITGKILDKNVTSMLQFKAS